MWIPSCVSQASFRCGRIWAGPPSWEVGRLQPLRAWGAQNDPEGTDRLLRFEFFEELDRLAKDSILMAKHLTSRPDWRELKTPLGVPALWQAVSLNSSVLRTLAENVPEHGIPWETKTSDGKDLWFALVNAKLGDTQDAVCLAKHVTPAVDGQGTGWLCADLNQSLLPQALHNGRVRPEYLERWTAVAWMGSPGQQEDLARRLLDMAWPIDLNDGRNTLMRASIAGFTHRPLEKPMHPSLAAFVAIWVAAQDDLSQVDGPSVLARLFPRPFALPELSPPCDDPPLWNEGHPWSAPARSRLRAWASLNNPSTPVPASSRNRHRP